MNESGCRVNVDESCQVGDEGRVNVVDVSSRNGQVGDEGGA